LFSFWFLCFGACHLMCHLIWPDVQCYSVLFHEAQ
jgi:hypothetical protein